MKKEYVRGDLVSSITDSAGTEIDVVQVTIEGKPFVMIETRKFLTPGQARQMGADLIEDADEKTTKH